MNQTVKLVTWEQNAPYTKMLQSYQAAAEMLTLRIGTLKTQLSDMQMHKRGTLDSAREQKLLEDRILLLRSEYTELTDVIRQLRIYAAKENA